MRSTLRYVAAATATVLASALTATVFAVMAPPAAQARVIASAGLVLLVDTGAVIIGTAGPSS